MTSSTLFPGYGDVGRGGPWKITNQYGESTQAGELLGLGSSHRPRHQRHPNSEYAPQHTYCSHCRWMEIRIFAAAKSLDTPPAGRYLVVKRGASAVPGERDFVEWEWVHTSHEVLDLLTTRRGPDAMLTTPASRALAQAAGFDSGIREVWLTRTVK